MAAPVPANLPAASWPAGTATVIAAAPTAYMPTGPADGMRAAAMHEVPTAAMPAAATVPATGAGYPSAPWNHGKPDVPDSNATKKPDDFEFLQLCWCNICHKKAYGRKACNNAQCTSNSWAAKAEQPADQPWKRQKSAWKPRSDATPYVATGDWASWKSWTEPPIVHIPFSAPDYVPPIVTVIEAATDLGAAADDVTSPPSGATTFVGTVATGIPGAVPVAAEPLDGSPPSGSPDASGIAAPADSLVPTGLVVAPPAPVPVAAVISAAIAAAVVAPAAPKAKSPAQPQTVVKGEITSTTPNICEA